MRELHRFLRGMVAWAGYPQTYVRYHREPRCAGTTKYPFFKMVNLAWRVALSFSALPLRLSFLGAGAMNFLAFEEAIRAVAEHFSGQTVPGWTSLMVIVCLSNAALMISVGSLGEYVGRIFEEGKARLLYVVADTWNLAPHVGRQEIGTPLETAAVEGRMPPPQADRSVWTPAARSDNAGRSLAGELKTRR